MPPTAAAFLLLAAQGVPPTPPVPPAPEKRVCKSQAEVGSRIPKRICHTAAEWRALERASQEETQRNQRYRASRTPG